MEKIEVRRFYKRKFTVGLLLVALGILMPRLFTVMQLHIPRDLITAIREENTVYVMIAALKLVSLNILRCLPHYLGTFIMADSIVLTRGGKELRVEKAAIVLIIIPQVYFLIERLFDIRYDFGVPAFVLIGLLLFLGRADYNLVSLPKKLMMVTMFISAVQFLDVMPALSALPVGRGETSTEIKFTAAFLEAEGVLQSMALLFFVLFMLVGLLLYMLVRDENNLRAVGELKKQNEEMMMETRLRVLENRTYAEMRHLVHDLKSPLTSAQALVSLVKLASEQRGDLQEQMYLQKIESSIERMSGMISEILNENHFTPITTQSLFDAVLADISVSEYASLVEVYNDAPHAVIEVNKIRFVRALVNLIENAFYAVDKQSGRIGLSAVYSNQEQEHYIILRVEDNGRGIPQDVMQQIWESGFSTRSSHGLGLSFVKQVVTSSGGTIHMESRADEGTDVTIVLPEGKETDE